jgi:hypothetical protein
MRSPSAAPGVHAAKLAKRTRPRNPRAQGSAGGAARTSDAPRPASVEPEARPTPPTALRLSWGAIADAVGHSVLVFVFVPTLAALPGWLRSEVALPLNGTDPTVTLFMPIRGLIALMNAFTQGMNAGLIAGLLNGVLVCAWVRSRGAPAKLREQLLLGAGAGGTASFLMAAALLSLLAIRGGELAIPFVPVAFEISSGVVCGVLSVFMMLRLLARPDAASLDEAP